MAKRIDSQMNEIVRLKREGLSKKAIGERLGIDPRTVKSRLEFAEDLRQREYWESVSRQVDVGHLESHQRLMVRVSMKVLGIIQTEPMDFTSPDSDASSFVDRMLYSLSESFEDLQLDRGVEVDSLSSASVVDQVGRPSNERLGRKLWDSLMEHESHLNASVEEWRKHWSQFQTQRAKLSGQASSMPRQFHGEEENSVVQGKDLAEAALRSRIRGHVPKTSDEISHNDVVEKILNSEMMRLAVEAYEQIMQSVLFIEELVDIIVLRGKPLAVCQLCPKLPVFATSS